MTPRDDVPYEMFGSWLDQDAVDRLLVGRMQPDDAPPGFEHVARLILAVDGPPEAVEFAGERAAVVAAVRVLRDPAPNPGHARRWRMRSRLTRAKVAGLVAVGTLIGTTGMAAANVLPDPAQDVASNALSHVGITVPSSRDAITTGTTTVDATSVDHPASTGEEISRIATTTDASGVAKGAEISSAASGGIAQAGVNGDPAGAAGESSGPGDAGTSVADDASGGADQHGSSTGGDASGGHADAGAGNAPSAPPTP